MVLSLFVVSVFSPSLSLLCKSGAWEDPSRFLCRMASRWARPVQSTSRRLEGCRKGKPEYFYYLPLPPMGSQAVAVFPLWFQLLPRDPFEFQLPSGPLGSVTTPLSLSLQPTSWFSAVLPSGFHLCLLVALYHL